MTARWKLVLGPPGTGKTETCIRIVEQELRSGLAPNQIAFVTFARAAVAEAKMRAENACTVEMPHFLWFRTMHSMAFKLGGLERDRVLTPDHWAEFGRMHGYRFTLNADADIEDGPGLAPAHTPDDLVRALHDWARNTRRTLQEALASSSLRVGLVELQRYAARYEAYKRAKGLVDYIDMIERALDEHSTVRVAVIDEAQDLSPLLIAAAESWFADCDRVYVAGDDDQSIYGFQGADPSWLVRLARTPGIDVEVLARSQRVPRAPHAFAQSIIARNAHRVAKEYLPRDADGLVEKLPLNVALRSIDAARDSFILVRNRCFADDVIAEMMRLGVPYASSVRGPSPLDPDRGVVRAVRAANAILRGVDMLLGDLLGLVRRVPTRGFDLVPHGIKAALEREPKGNMLTPVEVHQRLGGGTLPAVLKARGLVALLHGADVDGAKYVERVFAKHSEDVVPKLEVATVHGSKGRGASQVVIVPDMTKATYQESLDVRHGGREAETRVAYVGATRTYDRLTIAHAQTGRSYPYPRT